MPFVEESSPFLVTSSSHELRYNRQNKKLALVPTGRATNAAPDREIEQHRVAGSVSMLAQTIHHDLSVYYTDNPPSDNDADATRHTIQALAQRMNDWLAREDRNLIELVMNRFHPDTTADADPFTWLVTLLGPASGAVWQLFLSFHCETGSADEADEKIVRMFITMHLQCMYQIFLSNNPSLATPGTDSEWVKLCEIIDGLETYDNDVDRSRPQTLQHEKIMEGMVGAVENVGFIDHFVYAVDPDVVVAALVRAVEWNGLAADDEEVVMLVDLFICVAVFDICRRPVEAETMMGYYTRPVAYAAVNDVIRARARQIPSRTVAEPFRSRLELLSE